VTRAVAAATECRLGFLARYSGARYSGARIASGKKENADATAFLF